MGKTRIIVISGPTGIGKTGLSVRLAEKFGGEIVGADSMQIYKYMDIGTAKPTEEERARAVHHMTDIANPDEPYDAARYLSEARAAVDDIVARKRLPIVVGGTGFYIKALLYGLFEARPEDKRVRSNLWKQAGELGTDGLYRRLEACDPEAAGRIHPNDTYRVVRALEVYEITGRTMSAYRREHGFSDSPYNALKFALYMDRNELYRRIDHRVELMIEQGLVEEVRDLLEMGFDRNLKSMQALGYRHVLDYLEGTADLHKIKETLKRDTRRYAKRQLTWFRADPEINWVRPDQEELISGFIRRFIEDGRP